MSTPRRAGSEVDVLRSAPVLVATPGEVESERAHVLPWLEQQIRELPLRRAAQRRKVRRNVLVGSSLVAAAAAVAFVIVLEPWVQTDAERALASAPTAPMDPPAATLLDGRLESGALQVLPGSRLGDESRFRTPSDAGARLLTAAGATLAAAPDTEFALEKETTAAVASESANPATAAQASGALIQLSRGSIDFAVPKLAAGRRFQVKTSDALVTVVGTRFFVGAGAPTCVRVEEGSVEVQRAGETRMLAAGDTWGCALPGSSASGDAREATVPRSPEKAAQASRQGQLDQQNRLLATALAAERRGDITHARAAFADLLRRHPDSPFGPEARAGLARLKGR
jgi:ferric-dicitrate binding protein FerR (iron transport regulator)